MVSDYSSTFLLPNNSFFVGAGSVLNISWSYFDYNTSKSPEEADYKAILNDFGMVGKDMKVALDIYKHNNKDVWKNRES